MRKNITETPKKKRLSCSQLIGRLTVGIDLGDRSSRYCILDQEGEVVAASAVATTKKDLSRVFGALRHSEQVRKRLFITIYSGHPLRLVKYFAATNPAPPDSISDRLLRNSEI